MPVNAQTVGSSQAMNSSWNVNPPESFTSRVDPTPVAGVPEVAYENQGGLLEVALHPNFASNRFVYLTYAKRRADGSGASVRSDC